MAKRIAAVTAVICLMVSQICFIMPSQTYAADEKAGETLTIRVGYWGDVKDYREKTSFTNTEMKNMPM